MAAKDHSDRKLVINYALMTKFINEVNDGFNYQQTEKAIFRLNPERTQKIKEWRRVLRGGHFGDNV